MQEIAATGVSVAVLRFGPTILAEVLAYRGEMARYKPVIGGQV